MTKPFKILILATLFSALYCQSLFAAPPKNLPYPQEKPAANEIAEQVYYVNHFYSVKNIAFVRDGKGHVTTLIFRKKDKRPRVVAFRRYLNNAYANGPVKSRDLGLFHSGKLEGVRLLLTDYSDEAKEQTYQIWLPSLRKVRKVSEPDHDEAWRDSEFTYGDVYLRKPEHETHELLGEETFTDCLGSMKLNAEEQNNNRLIKNIPRRQCDHRGKNVYKLKSTTKYGNWWYDYRISYIDQETFADYRIDYFKDGKQVKRIDKDWTPMIDEVMDIFQDSRAVFWRYWYGKNYLTGNETMINTWPEVVRWNQEYAEDLWSEDRVFSQQ
ncbi:MAG: outer membrane lipoprotein-sorting protein [Gammaproteobacteria bacterium]|nr:outer membrane lipoprotein-sorting protein [Gammaproteobacteria bacterium]